MSYIDIFQFATMGVFLAVNTLIGLFLVTRAFSQMVPARAEKKSDNRSARQLNISRILAIR
jgi:hypothetical protein